ncbi:hypothetical protein COW36_04230 [bacterium (Candidatus Blackallbacteria) CG17_big_fil_post_rev_8_21_14_2_50_48_46]|uniref:Porin n=1 Tax=bacterium (Candidatus Blackallbacteria) CG17_big_fil_post_rev_8_21_14_2_50_48_46 TaxID=2014261 RepID=A0A2M7G8R6_9BACT|nr:MAG: hypothetical protein COW64_04715 [bacterium (Candidatus Blackallbacteria) CG18_big_fil_WC_8_21_14_2_50_49_26]PIW18506.1 MAG: hypothetical protein COW36_04230 [bacterium (Candidatus Blackallbacteria) CG17_big_fil_post_rev_8_21_14_2_50_48_46]PIW46509.1 MAG: hypothetical protein COW20_16450 [bacterium (Candidatus Blackallbacteria) CG13_big_fil_rev_8_21_14_2_50_49_14]
MRKQLQRLGPLFFFFVLTLPLAAKEDETFRIRGRIQTGWELLADNNTGAWSDELYVRRARLDGRWKPFDWVKLVLELEFAKNVASRDVYAEFKLNPDLELTVGRFKKPFSRLRMMSPWDMLIPERGLLDQHAIDDTKYGGFGARDYGVMLAGDLWGPTFWQDPLKFSWNLGAFNSLPGDTGYHRDFVARGQLRLFKGLLLAVDGSVKLYEESAQLKTASLWGADLKWEWDPFRLQIEGALGDNVNQGSKLWGAHSIVSWEFPLSENLKLIPALMFEVFDPDLSRNQDFACRFAGALNLDIYENIRVLLSVDKTWQELGAAESSLPDPLQVLLQTNLKF